MPARSASTSHATHDIIRGATTTPYAKGLRTERNILVILDGFWKPNIPSEEGILLRSYSSEGHIPNHLGEKRFSVNGSGLPRKLKRTEPVAAVVLLIPCTYELVWNPDIRPATASFALVLADSMCLNVATTLRMASFRTRRP